MGALLGLAVGLAVAGVVYLKDRHSDSAPVSTAAKVSKRKLRSTEAADSDSGESTASDEPKGSYDFYSRLPKFEVVIPEKEKGCAAGHPRRS